MNTLYRITISLAAVLISTIMPAADLPQLPVASSIKTGTLDNGIAYYLVTNSTEKGKAVLLLSMSWDPLQGCLISEQILLSAICRETVSGPVPADMLQCIVMLPYIDSEVWT